MRQFSTWLLRIASHAAREIIRKRKGLPTISLDGALENSEIDGKIPHPEFVADWRHSPEELVQAESVMSANGCVKGHRHSARLIGVAKMAEQLFAMIEGLDH